MTLLLEMQTLYIFKLRLCTSYLHENRPYVFYSLTSIQVYQGYGLSIVSTNIWLKVSSTRHATKKRLQLKIILCKPIKKKKLGRHTCLCVTLAFPDYEQREIGGEPAISRSIAGSFEYSSDRNKPVTPGAWIILLFRSDWVHVVL